MRNSIILFLLIPILICCKSNKQTDSITLDSNDSICEAKRSRVDSNNVSKVEYLIYWSCDSTWKKIRKVEEKLFDYKGNLLRWVQYGRTGSPIIDESSYEYVKDVKVKKYFKAGPDKMMILYFYGKNGRLEKEVEYVGEIPKTVSRYYFKSDKDTNPFKKIDFDAGDNEPIFIWEYYYDKFGHLVKEDQSDSNGLYESNSYEYNVDGLMIKHLACVNGQDGGVQYYYIYDGQTLVKDSVVIFDSPTKYHLYERLKIEK